MPRAMRIRNASWLLRALSLVTLAALVVAQACAPLCAAQNCQPSYTQAAAVGNCHWASAVPHEAPSVRAVRNCGSPELPAIVLNPASPGGASAESRWSPPDGKFLAVELEKSASGVPLSTLCSGRSHDSVSSFAPVTTGVLRI